MSLPNVLPATCQAGLSPAPRQPAYDRDRDLPRLLRLWPSETARLTAGDQPWLVGKLRQMLRAERQRALTSHWTYDLTRHLALLRAYRGEVAILSAGSPMVQKRRWPEAVAMIEEAGAPASPPWQQAPKSSAQP